MGSCLEERGNLAILIYFAVFGVCYLSSSSLYLINLQKISMPNDDPDAPCVPGLLAASSDPLSVINCADVNEWKLYALLGIVYGILCLIVAIIKLWPILKRIYCAATATAIISQPIGGNGGRSRSTMPNTFGTAAGTKAVKKANDGVRRLVKKDEEKRTWTTVGSSCCHCMSTCSLFLAVILLWIISVTVPGFLAINLYKTDAIRAKEDHLYVPAISLFATCLTSFTAVCVSCAFIILEESDGGGWSHAVLDEESKEISDDPEDTGVTITSSSQPLRQKQGDIKNEAGAAATTEATTMTKTDCEK